MNLDEIQKYDLAICYRIYPKVSKVPPIFQTDKLKLAELCLSSFKVALGDLRYKIIVLLDNCPPSFEELFQRYFDKNEIEIIRLKNAGNPGSFGKQCEVLLNQNYSEYIYFAEDDYFYLPEAFKKMLEAIQSRREMHFLSPYYHPDYDNLLLHKYKSEQIEISNIYWKAVATTTMTFMTTKNILNAALKTFLTYTKKNNDNSIWLSLTKKNIYNPYIYFYYLFKNWTIFKALIKIWFYTPFETISKRGYNLWIPKKTLATHMESNFLSLGEDWSELFDFYIKMYKI